MLESGMSPQELAIATNVVNAVQLEYDLDE